MKKLLGGLGSNAWPLWALAAVQLILQIRFLALGGVKYAVTSLAVDDTFYYLQTAWNARQTGFASFDGIDPTNGVQALWFSVVYGIAFLTPDKSAFFYAALVVCMLLNVACYWAIWKLSDVLGMRWLALPLGGLWALQTLASHSYSSGMENSLHALIFWLLMWRTAVVIGREPERGPRGYAVFAALLVLNVWSRLDSALFSGILLLFVLGYDLRRKASARPALLCGAALAVGVAVQLLFFRMLDDSYLPVSALIKTSRSSNESPFSVLASALKMSLPKTGALWGFFALAALVILGYRRLHTRTEAPSGLVNFMKLYTALATAFGVYHLSIAITRVRYREYFFWYRSPMYIFWFLTFALAAALVVDFVRAERQRANLRGALTLVGAGAALASAFSIVYSTRVNKVNMHTARYGMARWMEANYGPDVRFAAWNAGTVSYFSNRSVVNLDGLINSVHYYKTVLKGPVPAKEFLAKSGVRYIVDYEDDELVRGLPVVHVGPVAREKGTEYRLRIWKL